MVGRPRMLTRDLFAVANLLVIFVDTLYKHFEKELFAKTIVTL